VSVGTAPFLESLVSLGGREGPERPLDTVRGTMGTVPRIIASVLAVLVAAACAPARDAHPASGSASGPGATVRISTPRGAVVVRVRVAETGVAQARGLQGVRRMGPDVGMAFVFHRPSTARFWMKDTPLPLSIAFWGRDGRISAIMNMPPCRADPCTTYGPRVPFVGALEVHRGFFAGHRVAVGDRIAVERG